MSYIDWIRSFVGNRKILLVFATVIVRDENGRFLLQYRTDFDCWGLPGGGLELDEDIETCARRELLEETGLTVGKLTLTGVYTHPRYDVVYPNGDQVQQFTACFIGQMNGGVMLVDGVETSHQQFFLPAQLPELDLPVWYRDMLADAQHLRLPVFSPPYSAQESIDQVANVRPFIGHDRLIAVGAAVVIRREDGRILMIRRQDNGWWDFPSGYSNLGENIAYTAVREVQEETGLQIEIERIIGITSAPQFHYTFKNGDQVKNVCVIFQARWVGGEPRPDRVEISATAWMKPADILRRSKHSFYEYLKLTVDHLEEGVFIN